MTRRPKLAGRATPTIRDVAARAAVSTATVSHVVNATGRASAKTREKVLQAIQDLGFRPNGNAASLRSRKSRIIGLVIPSITNAFFAQMAGEFEALAMAGGYDIAIVTSNEDREREHERILALLSRQIDGLIIYPSSDESIGLDLDARTLPPTVLMDRGLGLAGFDTVGLANEDGGLVVARYLIELGHRDIAVVVPTLGLKASRDRVKGVEKALAECGLQKPRVVAGGHTIEGSRSAIEQELRREDRPTAVLAATNVATLGAIKAIQALQLDMPRDISLVGFDDFEWMTALRPFVSAFSQPTARLAAEAWVILLRQLTPGFDRTRQRPSARITMAGEFRIRESSGRAPGGA